MRLLILWLLVLQIAGCSIFSFGGKNRRIPLDKIEPTVQFVETEKVEIIQTDINQVSPEQVIRSYERLMQSPHKEIQRQAMRRLADLNMRLTDAKLTALSDGKTLEELPESIRNASYENAAKLYRQVIELFPAQADDASIRYQLARALALEGKSEESLLALDGIVEEHQRSPEMLEVEFRRGESYFLKREYRKAAQAYQNVILQGTESDYYDKALYKHGWSMFKASDYEGAILDFFPLLERLKSNQKLSPDIQRSLQDLVSDTQRAISLSFYNMDGASSVVEYFSKAGHKEYEYEIYDHLSKLYLNQERYQDAANTYLAFIKHNPTHIEAPWFQIKVAKTYVDGGFPSLVLPAKESLLTQFGVKNTYWASTTEENRKKLTPFIRKNLDEISSHYHSNAQKSKKRKDYLIAADWYSHFLILSKDETIVAPHHFLMAEAFFDAKDYERAIVEFDIIAYQYKQYSKREEAGYRILLALQAQAQMVDKNQPVLIQSYEEKIINYTLLFAEFFPDSSRSSDLMLRAAEKLVSFKRLGEAISTSEKLLLLKNNSKKNQDRAKVIIATGFFDLNEFDKAEFALSRVLNETLYSKQEGVHFHELRAQSIYKQAESLKLSGKLVEAVAEFKRLSISEPNSSVRPNADYDAAVLLLKLNDWSAAKAALENFQRQFSKHPLVAGIDEKLAVVYENLEQWNSAASTYERLAKSEKDPKKLQEMHWYIAELYEKSNNRLDAIRAFKFYIKTHPQPYLISMEARAKLIDLYELEKDSYKRDFWRNKIIVEYKKAGKANTDRTRYLAAQSSFALAEPLYQIFKKIKLTLPLNKSLKKKKAAMDKAISAYGEIAKFKVAEFATASTHRVGELYQTLAKDILSSERPKGMSEEEVEEYGYIIEDQAFPIEEKAIGIFQANIKRVTLNVYDLWVKKSFDALAKLQPARYDKQEQVEQWFGVN